MKKLNITVALIAASAAIFIAGCASPQSPPSAWEEKFFDVNTNYVPRFSLVTNTVVTPDPVTQIPVTNYSVLLTSNLVPEYAFTPNTNAVDTVGTIGGIINIAAPGIGSIVVAALGGLFGLYGTLRSRKSDAASAAMAQIIETGEQVLLTLPNGPEIATQWKAWMVRHQAETDTISKATQLVANLVDTEDARKAAAQIVALLKK